MLFTNRANDNEFFYDIPELYTCKFDNYNGFSESPDGSPLGTNYVYATTHQLIYSSYYISSIVPAAYTIASPVCYCMNGLSGRNRPVDIYELKIFFLFKPDNILMNTLEVTT